MLDIHGPGHLSSPPERLCETAFRISGVNSGIIHLLWSNNVLNPLSIVFENGHGGDMWQNGYRRMNSCGIYRNLPALMAAVWLALSLSACDRSGDEAGHAQLTQEQIAERIHLQKQLAAVKQTLDAADVRFNEVNDRLTRLRKDNQGRFIGKDITVGALEPMGEVTAKVAIVAFNDFQCSQCAEHVFKVLPRLRQNYIDTGKLRYYNRDYAQAQHSQAKYAAVAARCANGQGRYWAMFTALFTSQDRLSPQIYPILAHEVGLDPGPLTDCLTNYAAVKLVDDDFLYGQSVDVSSPPTYFIGTLDNAQLHDVIALTGTRPYEEFASVIDLMLAIDAAHTAMKQAHEDKLAARREITRLEQAAKRLMTWGTVSDNVINKTAGATAGAAMIIWLVFTT